MTAEGIARALEGHRAGETWMARCPAHDDRKPSLSIKQGRDGKILVRCHAGCSQWEVIRALAERRIWSPGDSGRRLVDRRPSEPRNNCQSHDDEQRTASAMRLWQETLHADGSPVVGYLRSRGLSVKPPPSLRFHPRLKHPTGGIWPAMVALVVDGRTGRPTALHRTFLAVGDAGKAPVVPQKMMLGPCRGGAVRLGEHASGGPLLIGEGIETCLAAMQATGRPAWAALSTSGLQTLRLPNDVDEIVVLADGDQAGDAAARAAAQRWQNEGRLVRIAKAPDGMDFNDLLLAGQESRS